MTKLPRTPKGLVYYLQWGSNRYAANAALSAFIAADLGINTDRLRSFAASQVYYMLGDCCDGRMSHVIGFGRAWPTAPHVSLNDMDLLQAALVSREAKGLSVC